MGMADGNRARFEPVGMRFKPGDVRPAPGNLTVGQAYPVQGGLPLQHGRQQDVIEPFAFTGTRVGDVPSLGLFAVVHQVDIAELAVGADFELTPQAVGVKDVKVARAQHGSGKTGMGCYAALLYGAVAPHFRHGADSEQGVVLRTAVLALNDTTGMLEQRDVDLAAPCTLGDDQSQGAIFFVFILDTAAYAQFDIFVSQLLEVALAHPFGSPFVRIRALHRRSALGPTGLLLSRSSLKIKGRALGKARRNCHSIAPRITPPCA